MQHLGLRPWVRREIGQEAQATVLNQAANAGMRGVLRPSQQSGLSVQPKASGGQTARLKRPATSVERPRQPVEAKRPSVAARSPNAVTRSPVHSEHSVKVAQVGEMPSPLSLIYAQVLPGFWLVAECDEWDRGSQAVFNRLLVACRGLAAQQGYQQPQVPQIEWFHWPLRLSAPIQNDEHSMRQALRGWVNGRRRPGAVWVSLGRRFVELLLPTQLAPGVRHQGRSGMDVVWFEGLPAMQIEPEHKAALWQFLQEAVPTFVRQLVASQSE